jgi:nucleoside diphosphate kinase
MLIDHRYGVTIPPGLSEIPNKATLYGIDTYFREGWEDLVTVAGEGATALAFEHSMMLVKPDALVSRRAGVVLDWLPVRGFSVVAAMPVSLGADQIKALWRYQWNCAPRIRKDAYMALFDASPSLLLVVRSRQDAHVSAAKRLANLKGPADPALQRRDDLRAWLGNATHLLSFVHAADEPADLARELAILLPVEARMALFARMRDGLEVPDQEVRALAASLAERMPPHDLAAAPALERIEALTQDSALEPAERETVAALCRQARAGTGADWRVLFALLERRAVPFDPWDKITIAAHTSDVSWPHLEALLGGAVPLDRDA